MNKTSKLELLDQQISDLKDKLAVAIEEISVLSSEEYDRKAPSILWVPEYGERYFYLTSHAYESGFWNRGSGVRIIKEQQLFSTEHDVELACSRRTTSMKVPQRIAELNIKKDWVCDW